MLRRAVLASGTGSLFEAIIKSGNEIELLIVDRTCRAQKIAHENNITCVIIERTHFGKDFELQRTQFTHAVEGVLRQYEIDYVVMAGFMTILAPTIFVPYRNRILNCHPSLLPAFTGSHAVRDALRAGVSETGCTIHLATEEMDVGEILAQEAVAVLPGDTVETLHERIKVVERRLLPKTIVEYEKRLTHQSP